MVTRNPFNWNLQQEIYCGCSQISYSFIILFPSYWSSTL
jgi:hypothetical protein